MLGSEDKSKSFPAFGTSLELVVKILVKSGGEVGEVWTFLISQGNEDAEVTESVGEGIL